MGTYPINTIFWNNNINFQLAFPGACYPKFKKEVQKRRKSIRKISVAVAVMMMMHFFLIQGLFRDRNLYVYGKRFPVVDRRFLGIILDHSPNIAISSARIEGSLYKAVDSPRALHLSWKVDRTVFRLYSTLILSKQGCDYHLYSLFSNSCLFGTVMTEGIYKVPDHIPVKTDC